MALKNFKSGDLLDIQVLHVPENRQDDENPNRVSEYHEEQLMILVDLCQSVLDAEEVWLFGSRARGDFNQFSDWDVMAIISDNAAEHIMHPETLFSVKRQVDLPLDLIAARQSDFVLARDIVASISHDVKHEGFRIDI